MFKLSIAVFVTHIIFSNFSFAQTQTDPTELAKKIIGFCNDAILTEKPFKEYFNKLGWQEAKDKDLQKIITELVIINRINRYIKTDQLPNLEKADKEYQILANALTWNISEGYVTYLINPDYKEFVVNINGPIPKRCGFTHHADALEEAPTNSDFSNTKLNNLLKKNLHKYYSSHFNVGQSYNGKKSTTTRIFPTGKTETKELFGTNKFVSFWTISQ